MTEMAILPAQKVRKTTQSEIKHQMKCFNIDCDNVDIFEEHTYKYYFTIILIFLLENENISSALFTISWLTLDLSLP